MTKLQAALDTVDLEQALGLIADLAPLVDIIEAGTPFVLANGLEGVRRLKRRFPEKEILCDGKIMDAGAYEAREMFRAGADWVTVMACTDDATVAECVHAARWAGGRVMADMLCVRDMPARVAFLESAGVDCIAVHTGVDQQRRGRTALDDLRCLRGCVTRARLAVAGGISPATADAYLKLNPDILIVGGGIFSQAEPLRAAEAIRGSIRAHDDLQRRG